MARFTHRPGNEWGRKDRKEEEALRGLNASDRRAAIAEQVSDIDGCEGECETCDEARRARSAGRFVWAECQNGNTVRS